MTSEMMKENQQEIQLDAGVNDVTDLLSRINFPLMISMFMFSLTIPYLHLYLEGF